MIPPASGEAAHADARRECDEPLLYAQWNGQYACFSSLPARARRGLAPGAKIVAIRVADATGHIAWTSQVISALDWIAASPLRVDAVNMSFAIGFLSNSACDGENPALTDALGRVRARGTVLVAASGNDAATHGIRPPACIGGVLSVGAVYHSNLESASLLGCTDTPAEVDRVTCFSNSAAQLDLLAPVTAFARHSRRSESRAPAERPSQRRMWPGRWPCCGKSIPS
jgi:hypothetical protein